MTRLPKPPPPGSVKPHCLLVVDAQAGFVTDASRHVLQPIATVQARFETVIYAKFTNPDPSPFRSILHYDKLGPSSAETSLATAPSSGAAILEHTGYSCVTQELRDRLRAKGVTEICVCGIATEACVLKTVVDLFELCVIPWVIQDLCASDKSGHFHNIAIEVIGALIGQQHVITTETLAVMTEPTPDK